MQNNAADCFRPQNFIQPEQNQQNVNNSGNSARRLFFILIAYLTLTATVANEQFVRVQAFDTNLTFEKA